MKDIVAIWAAEVKKAGLHLGLSVHASHTWNWLETAQGSDSTGPLAGVPYDGKLTVADGAGTWWGELGLDPQDLYAQNHPVGGGGWEFEGSTCPPSSAYIEKFYNRTIELVDKFDPDLLYFDDWGPPLWNNSDCGLRIAAHLYNTNMSRRNGRLDAVYNTKRLTESQSKCMVIDFERGQSTGIQPYPWQTDTCIGNWFYQRSVFENHQYKTPDLVVKTLLDIVSKNGNLLLNIPLKSDGTIDSDEVAFLQGFTAWMKVNDESIFKTRPWKVFGEGPLRSGGGDFTENKEDALGEADFRFTTKGDILYAAAMGWPADGVMHIHTLAGPASGIVGQVRTVDLLGHGPVSFVQADDGLDVTLPATKPCDYAYVLKIQGLDLNASAPQPVTARPIEAEADGSFILQPELAALTGILQLQAGDIPNIGYWNNTSDSISWTIKLGQPGEYRVAAKASAQSDSSITFADGNGATAVLKVKSTGSWYSYRDFSGDVLNLAKAGVITITVTPTDPSSWQPVNLATVTLTPLNH